MPAEYYNVTNMPSGVDCFCNPKRRRRRSGLFASEANGLDQPMNGAQWLVGTLKQSGVDYIFVLCGNGLAPFLDACCDSGLEVIDTRNEQAAAYMADLWGRSTGRLGVVAVSSGPGHTNALTGLANSFWDGGPMLLISGCSESSTRGRDHFQELDQVGMASPVCKYAGLVQSAENLPYDVHTAITRAVSGRPGPAHLTIPLDVWMAEVPPAASTELPCLPARVEQTAPGDPATVREAVAALKQAKSPFVIVGSGAFYARAGEAIERFARLTGIPVMSQLWDRGCLNNVFPQYMGVASAEFNGAVPLCQEADVVLVLGARLDHRLGYGQPPMWHAQTRFIRVDSDPGELLRGVVPAIGIQGDPRSVVEQMHRMAVGMTPWVHQEWLTKVQEARLRFLARWEERGREDVCPLPAIRICREIKPFLDRDVTFLLDGGNIGRWAHMVLFDRHPAHWYTCGASGVIGWGLPGAVAARLARPGKPVLLLSGDGSAGFTLAEIETALRFGTPYVAVIAHDGAWGIVADGQPEGRYVASRLGTIRFDRVAQALGADGVYVDDPRHLAAAIEEGLARETVTFIHVPTQWGGIARLEAAYASADECR